MFRLDEINVSFLDQSTKTLPLVLSPRYDNSLEFLCKWIQENRPWIDDQILQYGAVLIRGFQIKSAADFEKATLLLQPNLSDQYRGTSPRSLMDGTKYSFSAADVPVTYPIAQHLEMSFLKAPPRQIYFGCLKESKAVSGGETSLCDFRKVYQDLPPKLIEKFVTKKIQYHRMHLKRGDRFTYDVAAMLSWMNLFDTTDKKQVEMICEEEGTPPVQWVGANNDTFLQEWVDDPVQIHPITKEEVWFNHSQVFHWTTFPSELWLAYCRVGDVRILFHCVLVTLFNVIMYGILGYKMSLDTTFADGKPISKQEIDKVRTAIHKNMIFSRWRRGDILCIDNFSTSHGRQPTYDLGRKVIVAWSQPHPKKTEKPSQASKSIPKHDVVAAAWVSNESNDDSMPDLSPVTPGSSPDSTLTETDASELSNRMMDLTMKNGTMKSIEMSSSMKESRRNRSCPSLFANDSEFWKKIQ